MIQAVAMLQAEVAVRGVETPDVLLEAFRYLAHVQLRGGNSIAAADTLVELLQLAPDDPYALRTSGVIAVSERDWGLAEAHFGSYLLFHPDSADAQLMMGNLMLEIGRLEMALEYLTASVALDPEEHLAYRSLGTTFEQLGRFEDAATSFERYLELAGDPADAAQIRSTLAMLRRSPVPDQKETIW
jgi:predicted Zn-dependent protease